MRTLIAFLLLTSAAYATDVEAIVKTKIAIAKAKHSQPTPAPKAEKPKTFYTEVKQVFHQRVTRNRSVTRWNWEGIDNPTHTFAVQHLRNVHSRSLPQHIDIGKLDMEDLNRIHSHLHEGHSIGKWEPLPVDPKTGIQVVIWHWTL